MGFNKIVIASISLFTLALFGLTYISWNKKSKTIDFASIENKRKGESISGIQEQYDNFVKNLGNSTTIVKPAVLTSNDTLHLSMSIELLDSMRQYGYAAYLSERLATINKSWYRHSQSSRYYLMENYSNNNPTNSLMYYQRAKVNLEKSLELNPNNNSAKIDLAICVKTINDVLPPSDPLAFMQPAKLLLDVVKNDSNNADAQYYLGRLAVESNQYEKAIVRLKKVVSLQPQNKEIYSEIAEIYQLMGNDKEAKQWLEKANNN